MGIGESIGLNLRLEFIDQLVATRPKLAGLEIIAENWFRPGPNHGKLHQLRETYPLALHGVGMNIAGEDPLDSAYLEKIKSLIETFQPHTISDHLAMQRSGGIHHHDLLPFPYTQASIERISNRIETVQNLLGRRLLIENLSYYVEFRGSELREVELLNTLSEKTGCGVLLDVNNIWVNQQNLGISTQSYLKELEWKNVGEIHIAGAEEDGDLWVDTHGSSVRPEVIELAKQAKFECPDVIIIYERDQNIPGLADLVRECHAIEGWIDE